MSQAPRSRVDHHADTAHLEVERLRDLRDRRSRRPPEPPGSGSLRRDSPPDGALASTRPRSPLPGRHRTPRRGPRTVRCLGQHRARARPRTGSHPRGSRLSSCSSRRAQIPPTPTPRGIAPSSASMSSDIEGATSSSVVRETSSRTPHEMSNPTPPGDTTPSRSMSVAATPPMGKPYPQCTSGIAYEASTIPGRVATFATCSSACSDATAGRSDREANTMPGTRIDPRRSSRHRTGVSSTSSIACCGRTGVDTRPARRYSVPAETTP